MLTTVPATRLEERDFGRNNASGWFTLFLTAAVYLPGPLYLAWLALKDFRTDPVRLQSSVLYIAAAAAVYFSGLALILFYGVFDAFRYRLSEEASLVRGLFRWRKVRWSEVTRASVISSRGLFLVLFTGPRRFTRLPLSNYRRTGSLGLKEPVRFGPSLLSNYRRTGSLLDAVSQRLKAPVEIPPHLEPYIVD